MGVILAIDCGSTNHKVALFDDELRRLASSSTPVQYTVRDAQRVEFDPERIWQDTILIAMQACVRARIEPRQITTIAIASQAQTFTILTPEGRPIVPFLSWADKRAHAESLELKEKLGHGFHRHCSFPAPIPQLQLSKLLWCARHLPEALSARAPYLPSLATDRRLPITDLRIVSLPSFLALRFAGFHVTDTNLAAMSGLYSQAQAAWWPEAVAAAGWPVECLGRLVHPGVPIVANSACPELDLAPDVHVVLAGNDQTAGAYANMACLGTGVACSATDSDPGDLAESGHSSPPDVEMQGLVLTLGTALVAYRFAGENPGPFDPAGCWGPFPGGGFYELVTRDEGCAALDWAVTRLTPGDEAAFFDLAASAPIGRAQFYPQQMHTPDAWRGSSDPAARARAVLEGISFSLRDMLGHAERPGHSSPSSAPITVIGGGSVSALWLQILANVLNRSVTRGHGDILLGAAMIARPGIQPPCATTQTTFSPELHAAEKYDCAYNEWRRPEY